MQKKIPKKKIRQVTGSRNNLLVAIAVFFGSALIVILFILVHYIGRMEGKIESLQSTLSSQQQLKTVKIQPPLKIMKESQPASFNITEKSINKKITIKHKKVERTLKKKEIHNDKSKVIDEVLVKNTLDPERLKLSGVSNNKTTVKQKTEKKVVFKANIPKNVIKGTVLVVQPDQKKIMINVGRTQGLQKGRRLVLWRDGTYIGEVEAYNIFADMTACEIITMSGSGIFVGDKVYEVPVEVADATGIKDNTFRVTEQ